MLKNKSYEVREEILPEQFFERFRTTVRKPRKRSCDDSDPNHDEDDEILGSDDDEQESPKDYCKVCSIYRQMPPKTSPISRYGWRK